MDGEEQKESKYGVCECGSPLEPVFFMEKEYKTISGIMVQTGRKRRACSHLLCTGCMRQYPVDDTFDGPWH